MNIPDGLRFTKDHEWLRISGEEAYVGITDFAQKELGDIVFVEVETIGESLNKGSVFGTIEAVKTVSDLFIPVSGKVLEINNRVLEKPEIINTDPYGEGWIIKIAIENKNEIADLLVSEQYRALINS